MRITRTSRDTYQFSSDFFRPDGGVTFQDYASARRFAAQLSAHRNQRIPASDIYAMQLIDMSLPLHWTADGLPMGMLFTARIADEATLFRLAGQLEQVMPWRDRVAPHAVP